MKFFSEDIAETIRGGSLTAERNGELSPEVLSFIYDQRLFKLFVPEALNGEATCLPKAIKIFEESAYIDGSFGWLVTIGSGGGYFAPIFAPDIAKKHFSPANAVVAGSGHTTGRAQPVEGGYRVTGSWKYCSGSVYATIFTANCLLPDGSVRSFIFTPDQVHVARDWDAYGLKATGSHTMCVADVFVPESMTFDIAAGTRHHDHAVYHYPFLQFAEASFSAVNAGICMHFFDEALAAVELHKTPETSQRYHFVRDLITQQQALLTAAREQFYEAVERSWEAVLHDKSIPQNILEDVSRTAKNLTKVALSTAQTVYPYLGLSVTMERNPINRCWRDLHTASQHILLKTFE